MIRWHDNSERPQNDCKCFCMVKYCGKLQPMILRYIEPEQWVAPGIWFNGLEAVTKWIPFSEIVDLLNANEEDGK